MTPKHAVIVIDPCKIQELVNASIGCNEQEAIRLVGANNIGIPVFVNIFNDGCQEDSKENWFDMYRKNQEGKKHLWAIPREACKSILYV